MTIRVANTDFDRVEYDADADVLYLAAGDPERAVDFDETPEGHAVRYVPGGELVGITIINARRLLDEHGAITITVPETISAAPSRRHWPAPSVVRRNDRPSLPLRLALPG